MSIDIITLGCRLNTYESEVMRAKALEAGLDNAVIVNTCAVTSEAVRQARQSIRRARKDNPDARIIVTGCAVQTDPEAFAGMPEVDKVLGNADKLQAASYRLETLNERVVVNDIMSVKETASHLIAGFDGRARAFVQIQNGCDHRCTFCIIPYGRGPSRSVPAGSVVEDVKRRVACHESGHALVAASLPHTDPVHKISIIPRGMGALGYMLQLPEDDRELLTQSELQSRIAVLLGGISEIGRAAWRDRV